MNFAAMLEAANRSAKPGTGRGSGTMRKEKEYTEILADGPKTTREIADALGITREGCMSSLGKLLRRGFVAKDGLTENGSRLWRLKDVEL